MIYFNNLAQFYNERQNKVMNILIFHTIIVNMKIKKMPKVFKVIKTTFSKQKTYFLFTRKYEINANIKYLNQYSVLKFKLFFKY